MVQLSDKEVEVIGLYGVARKMLVDEIVSSTPIIVAGLSTIKYVAIPVKRPQSYASALDAASRLQLEGFYPMLFYPEWSPEILHLVVIWDSKILRHPSSPMPCLFCPTQSPSWEKCGFCDNLRLWEKDTVVPGKVLKPLLTEAPSTTYLPVEGAHPQIDIPTAEYMQSLSDLSRYLEPDDFESPILYRVAKKLGWWGTCIPQETEPLPGVRTTQYITVPLSPRECSEKELLRKVINKLERNGFTCGPVESNRGRQVLFVCWDKSIASIFPKKSPCTLDCDEIRGALESCYCTQYDAWIADWKHTTFSMKFMEQ